MRYITKLIILDYNLSVYLHILTKKNIVILEKDYRRYKKLQKLIDRLKISC